MDMWGPVGISGTLATVTVLIVQFLKPFVELIPGITSVTNRAVHDNLLRLLQFVVNLGLLVLAQAFIPGSYDGVALPAIVLIVLGQFGFSQVTYQWTSKGGTPTVAPVPQVAPLAIVPVVQPVEVPIIPKE